jgi:hypothetical protein
MKPIGALLLALAAALPAVARQEFVTTVAGQRISGSNVCLWRAGDESAYFAKFMGDGTEVLCLSADHVLDLPAGAWNYFAYHDSAYVSVHPGHVTVYEVSDEYHATEVELVPAGTLDFTRIMSSLAASDEVVVYVPNDPYPRSPSAMRRLVGDDRTMLVPAGAAVVPMIIRAGVPVAVGEPAVVRTGETKLVEPIAASTTIIVPVRLALSDALWRSGGIVDPVITVRTAEGKGLEPRPPPRRGTGIERSLLIVRPVRAGAVTFRLEGARWKAAELTVRAVEGAVTLAEKGLTGVPAAEVNVAWELSPDAVAVRRVNPACNVERAAAAVRLWRCDSGEERANCASLVREIAEAAAMGPLSSGRLQEGSLDAGTYEVEFSFPPLPARRTRFTAKAAEMHEEEQRIDVDTISGRVTRGGKAVLAGGLQAGGTVVTTSELDGSYTLPVQGELGIVPVQVGACDKSFRFTAVPEEPVPAGATFDIDIPDNGLEISVSDARSGASGRSGREPLQHRRACR